MKATFQEIYEGYSDEELEEAVRIAKIEEAEDLKLEGRKAQIVYLITLDELWVAANEKEE